MNLATVIGKVWATRKLPALQDAVLLILQPVDGDGKVWRQSFGRCGHTGCPPGAKRVLRQLKEASMPMPDPAMTAIDACIVGIVDHVDR